MNQVQRALLLGGCVLAAVAVSVEAFAHDQVLLKCGNSKSVKFVSDAVLPNGMLAERYDTDGDGQVDVVALSHTQSIKMLGGGKVEVVHDSFPVFYVVDLDGDNKPDMVYVDTAGDGVCSGISLYEDLTGPITDGDAMKRGGLVGGTL